MEIIFMFFPNFKRSVQHGGMCAMAIFVVLMGCIFTAYAQLPQRLDWKLWLEDTYIAPVVSMCNAIAAIPSGSMLIIAQDKGFIMTSTSSGQRWRIQHLPTMANLYSAFFGTDSTCYVAGDSGVIMRLRYRPKGNVPYWEPTILPFPNKSSIRQMVWSSDQAHCIVLLADGKLYRSHDSGRTWNPIHPNNSIAPIQRIVIGENGTIIATGKHGVMFSYDYGVTWSISMVSYGLTFTHATNHGPTWFIASEQAKIFCTTDGGNQWQDITPPVLNNHPQKQTFGLFATNKGGLYLSFLIDYGYTILVYFSFNPLSYMPWFYVGAIPTNLRSTYESMCYVDDGIFHQCGDAMISCYQTDIQNEQITLKMKYSYNDAFKGFGYRDLSLIARGKTCLYVGIEERLPYSPEGEVDSLSTPYTRFSLFKLSPDTLPTLRSELVHSTIHDNLNLNYPSNIFVSGSDSCIIACTQSSSIMYSTNAGRNWVTVPNSNCSNMIAVLDLGTFIRTTSSLTKSLEVSTDTGRSWHPLPLPRTNVNSYTFWIQPNGSIVVSLQDSNVRYLYRTFNGFEWELIRDSITFSLGTHLCVTKDGSIITSVGEWLYYLPSEATQPDSILLSDIVGYSCVLWKLDTLGPWIIGLCTSRPLYYHEQHNIIVSTNGGKSWIALNAPPTKGDTTKGNGSLDYMATVQATLFLVGYNMPEGIGANSLYYTAFPNSLVSYNESYYDNDIEIGGIFPQPSSGVLTIKLPTLDAIENIFLYSLDGRQFKPRDWHLVHSAGYQLLSSSFDANNGVYLLRVCTSKRCWQKLVVFLR